jgi:hypothetical protein
MIKKGLKTSEEDDYYAKLKLLADTGEWEDEDKEGM